MLKMLIFCNGAFKSGSTWLHAIVKEILELKKNHLEEIPQRFWLHKNSPTKIIESKLVNFLEEYENEIKDKYFLTKSHFFQKETHTRLYPKDVIFLFIRRNIKDAVVSHYHHLNNTNKIKLSFNFYYYLIGRYKAHEIIIFNKICDQYHPKERFYSFENLKNNFEKEVLRISISIGIKELSEDEISYIKNQTSLGNMREKSKLKLSNYYPVKDNLNYKQFRKGQIGESLLFFTDKHNKDIDNLQRGEISFYTKLVYYLMFTFRRKILKIE